MSDEYVFKIDGAYKPDTIPMERLAKYLAALAELLGHKPSIHFVRLEEGSTKVVHQVDEPEAPKVAHRLRLATSPQPPADVAKAVNAIDDLLAADSAEGSLTRCRDGAVIIPFPGVSRPPVLSFPTFKQTGSIDGEIVSLGGKDKTAHVILKEGSIVYSNISVTREQARALAAHLYGGKVRLHGDGRWERLPDGAWRLVGFTLDRFESLDESALGDVLDELRKFVSDDDAQDAFDRLIGLRNGDEGLQ